jgi:hypothetical protein
VIRFGLVVMVLLACACGPPSQPRPTPVPPTPVPTPAQNAAALTGEDAADVQDAFLAEVDATLEQVEELSSAPCDRLTEAVQTDPTLVPRLKQYAGLLRQTAARDQSLVGPDVQASLGDLDTALRQLDQTLAGCGP